MSFNNVNVNVSGGQSIIKALQNYNTVIIKPNIVDNRNVLTQEMMSEKHTKYVIRWNYSLEGATINVPKDCIIEFAGGTIDNGTIVGDNTRLIYSKPIDEICKAERQGTWIYDTTVADEEDITSVEGHLKFKDRPATNGMGRKILRKNIVDGVNTLTQNMVSAANTIYIIQYDFTLGDDITVPANCILEFDGGSVIGSSSNPISFTNITSNSFTGNVILDVYMAYSHEDHDVYPFVTRTGSSRIKANGRVKDFITTSQLYYSDINSTFVCLNYNVNTPCRYGAVGDKVSDDTNALQTVLDVIGYECGDVDLRSISNNNAIGYLTTRPLVEEFNLLPPGHPIRKRITCIYSDYYSENDASMTSAGIYATNIPARRGALELKGYTNSVDCSTDIKYLYIDSSHNSNHEHSFALIVRENKLNNFTKCKFRGKNAVMSVSGYNSSETGTAGGRGYTKIDVKWDSCMFYSVGGYAFSTGYAFNMGQQNGDQELFLNCDFHGTTEVFHYGIEFINCMWSLTPDISRQPTTIGTFGYVPQDSEAYNTYVDFNTAILVYGVSNQGVFDNLYFEDPLTDIHFVVVKTVNGSYMTRSFKCWIRNSYFNGRTNYKDNGNPIDADYGIRIDNGINCQPDSFIEITNCRFRDGDGTNDYFFKIGSIVNESWGFPVKVSGLSNSSGNRTTTIFNEYKKYFGNLIFLDNAPIEYESNIYTLAAQGNTCISVTSVHSCNYKRFIMIIYDITQSDVAGEDIFLGEENKQITSKTTSENNYTLVRRNYSIGGSVAPIKFYSDNGNYGIFDSMNFAPTNTSVSYLGGLSMALKANEEYRLYTYINANSPFVGKQVKVILTNDTKDAKFYAIKNFGTFAEKPDKSIINVGFKYFCTDKQTTEGATDGIEIIHKGNNVWVDALGRVVS